MPPFGNYPYSWGGMGRSGWIGKTKRRGRKLQPRFTQHRVGRQIVLRPELKFKDTILSAVSLTAGSTAPFYPLNLMAPGTSASTRVGQSINIKSVQLALSFDIASYEGAINTAQIRVVLVMDSQANGAVPAETDIFETTNNVNSMRKIGETHRFRVLLDRKLVCNQPGLAYNGTAVESSSMHKVLKYYKKLNQKIYYNGTSGAVADVSQSNLVLFIYSDVILPLPRVSGVCRIRFTDL